MADIIKCQECGVIVGQYVSLADYQELEQKIEEMAGPVITQFIDDRVIKLRGLLERWNEIAPELTIKLTSRSTDKTYKSLNLELSQLIQDTSEAIK